MSEVPHVLLPGSARTALADVDRVGPVDPTESIDLTVVLRRRAEPPRELVEGPATVTPDELAGRFGADPADVDRVRGVFEAAGLRITDVHPASRRLSVTGSASAVAALFGTELSIVRNEPLVGTGPFEHRSRDGDLHVPASLDGIVVAVLGLDSRQQVRPQVRAHPKPPPHVGYDVPSLGTMYDFPAGTDGTGQVVAVLEFGGGFAQADLDAFFAGLGMPTPDITAAGVDGGSNTPGQSDVDSEVLMDVEVLGALAPGARQVVYFAPNTDQGFLDAISTAVHATPTPAVLSISWGQSEDQWTAQTRAAMDQVFVDAAALGVTVCAASGDYGDADGQNDGGSHVDFPASSPHVLACGGTSLRRNHDGRARSEEVWNGGPGHGAGGGGVSDTFPLPAWQAHVGVPVRAGGAGTGRGVPDVAAVADPATGYRLRIDGAATVLGGTSAVAPLWAALVCRLGQAIGRPLGMLQPVLYAAAAAGRATTGFRDVTLGNNGAYHAKRGWDPCAGLGVPKGGELLTLLRQGLDSGGQ